MSSGEVEPLGATRATNLFEPAIESNGGGSKAKQSSSNGHGFTIDGATITKTTPDELFDSVGDGLNAAAGLASGPFVITSEQDNLCDKELHAKTNEEKGNVSTIAIENNTIGAEEYDPMSVPKSILKNQLPTEPTFRTSNEASSEVKGQSYEDIMSSAYASPTPSQLPMTPPLNKSLDVISTVHECVPLTDNTAPLEVTLTDSSASQGVPPTVHFAMPQPHEAEVTPRDTPPSGKMQEGPAIEVGSRPEVAGEVASGNLNAPISVSAAEPSSNADNPSAGSGDNVLSQESDIMEGEVGAQVTNENSVALAMQAKKISHGECDDKPRPDATVVERAEQSPADGTPAPFLDETTAHTNETAVIPSSPSTEIPKPHEAGGTEVGKEAPEYATVAHGDVIVLEAVPASDHDSAKDEYGGKNPAKTEEPGDVTPTLVPNENPGHSEADAPRSNQLELSERLHETPTAVTMADGAKVGSTGDPSTGDQDPALPLSAETALVATSNNATGELKEEALPTLADVENLTFAPQCRESAVKEPGQAAPSKQEGWTTGAPPVHKAQAQAATDTQDLAPAGPADGTPAQSVGLSSATPDPQVSTNDPVVPFLPLVDQPEATNDQLFFVEASTAASLPDGTVANVQTEAEATQASEDQPAGDPDLVEKAIKEIPPTGTDQSDAPAPTPQAEESVQEPLVGLHQDQQSTESANETAQPCDPTPVAGGLDKSQIEAFFQEPQTTSVLEDSKDDDGPSPGSPSSVAIVNNLRIKEGSGAPLVEDPQEIAYIEGARGYDPTAIVNEPNIELDGVSVVKSMPALGGATQGEHDVTSEIQVESLDALANEHTEAVNAPIALNDQMDGLNLEGSNEIFEEPKTVDAVSEAPDLLTVGGIEQSAVEPPKGVEAYDRDKRPKTAINDNSAAGEPQTEMVQEHPIESIAPAQAEGQDTPANSILKGTSSKEVIPTDHSTILFTADIAEGPIHSVDQDGKPEGHPKPTSNESAVQGTVDVAPETREAIISPVSEAPPAEPNKIAIKPAGPIEFKDRQSAEISKDESPATNGEDSIAEPLKEAKELSSVDATSTSVMDPMKGIGLDHGFSGLTEDITPKPKLLHHANPLEEMRNADKSSVDRLSKKPALGETLFVDAVLASETCDESATKEEAVPDLANATGAQSFPRPSDISNNLQPSQVVEGVGAAVKLNGNSIGEQEAFSTPEPSKGAPPAAPTSESVAAGTTVGDTTTIEDSVEPLVVATMGDINSDMGGHPEQALQGACTGQVQGGGQEETAPVSESERKASVAPTEVVSTVKRPASDLNSEPQVTPVVDTVREVDEGFTTNSKEKKYNVEDPAPSAFESRAGGEEPQETGDSATPSSNGLHIPSEQVEVAPGVVQYIGCSPNPPASVIGLPDTDQNAYVDEFSLRGESLRPSSPKKVAGEAPQEGVLDQQSEAVKDGVEVKAPPFPADRLGGSGPPEEFVSYPPLPPLDESKASAPIELTRKGHGAPFESMSVIQSDGQRSQAPETSMMLGPKEPALHHIDPPATFTIEKGKHQPGPEGAPQKERPTTSYETPDTMGSYISRPSYEPPATTKHEVEPQPSMGVVRGPVMRGASVPVLSGDHTLLGHGIIVDRSSPEQGVQDHHPQVTNGAPLNIEGSDSKDCSAVEAVHSTSPNLQDAQGGGQDFSVPPAANYPSTDSRRPSEEGALIGTEVGEVSSVSSGPLVENTVEDSAVKRTEQERFSTIDTSGGENLARQTKEPVYFASDEAQPRDDPGATATKPGISTEKQTEDTLTDDGFKRDEVHGGVDELDHVETMQPNNVATINDQTILPTVEGRVEQSRELVPDMMSTPSVPLTLTTTTTIPDTVQGDPLTELAMIGDQGADGNATSGRDTTPGDNIASTSPYGQSAEPSNEVGATIASVQDVNLIDEPNPSGAELLSEINTAVVVAEDDADHTWVADDGEAATTVVLPDPPSTDPARSGSETIALAKLDTKLPHSETTLETLYISLLSPEEVHEQQISYLVGELPKVAVMVPPAGPQTTNQVIEIQEEKEAKQAAAKIEAERDEIERSVAYNVEPNAVEEARTAPVAFEDASPFPGESIAQEIGVSQSPKILDKPPNLAVQEQAAQDAGIEQLEKKAASEVSDDTISDEPAPTETSDGEPIAIATEASDFEDTQEILKPSAPAHGEPDLSLSLADAPLVTDSTPPPAVLNVTSPPPTEAAITTHVFKDEEHELREQGPLDVGITPGADGNKPPTAVAKDLEPPPSAEPTVEGVEVVENATSSNGVVVERTKGVAEELAAKGEAEKARIEQEAREAEKEKERQAQLKLEDERETEGVKVDEVERVELETLELQRQAGPVEKQTLLEEEAQKLRDTLIAKLEVEAARLEAEFKESEQARLLTVEKEIEEASDCPVAPETPRSALSSITSGFDSPSQISLASHMATAPDSPRIAPEDPTPFVELPESDLILQNRSPKSINSSIAGEPPETPLGSLPNTSLLASDLTPPARTFSQPGRPASFKPGSPLHISTENLAGNNSTENTARPHSMYDPPPVVVPKLSFTPASTAELYFTSKPEVVLPALNDMVFPFTGGVEDLPSVVEDEDADVLPHPVPRTRHLSTISTFSVSHRIPGGWTHSGTVAEGRESLEVAEGEFSPVPRTPRPSAVEPESDGERGSRCVIM